MYSAIMKITDSLKSIKSLSNNPSGFYEIFQNDQGPLVRRDMASSPEWVIQNLLYLPYTTGRFGSVFSLFTAELLATFLIRQAPYDIYLDESWYLSDYAFEDDPEAQYDYILCLHLENSIWTLTYCDPFGGCFSVEIKVVIEGGGNFPSLRIGPKRQLPRPKREDSDRMPPFLS